jgi:transcription elongation factor GreB
VTYARPSGEENTITIVGVDEVDMARNHVSWISPLARALMKSRPGDAVVLRAPGGVEELDVIDVRYQRVEVEVFVPTEAVFSQDKKT